jgi:hemoglobin
LTPIKAPAPARPNTGGMSQPARAASAPEPSRTTPFALIGGEPAIRRLSEAFYDIMGAEPAFAELRALHAADLGPMRVRLSDFLVQWMGGPRVYAGRHPGRGCVVSAHAPFAIDGRTAGQWVECMRRAFAAADVPAEARAMLDPAFENMCQGLRNDQPR